MGVRVSTKVGEVLYQPTPTVRVSTKVAEVVYKPTATVRVSTKVLEVLYIQQQPLVGSQIIWID